MLFSKVIKFDKDFWTGIFGPNAAYGEIWSKSNNRRISSDVYFYLLLQRSLILVTMFIFILSLVYSLLTNFIEDPNLNLFNFRWTRNWVINVLFGNKELVLHTWSWIQVSM